MSAKEGGDGKPRSVLVKESVGSVRSAGSGRSSKGMVEDDYCAKSGQIAIEKALVLQNRGDPARADQASSKMPVAGVSKEKKRELGLYGCGKEGFSSDGEESQDVDDSDSDSDSDNETKEDLNSKREYNRVCAAKSRAKRKKVLFGLNEKVDEEVTKYYSLLAQNRTNRGRVESVLDDTLSGILGESSQQVLGKNGQSSS